ncbi:alanine aminotransferase 2-like isoform X3 [Stylophora pistillata]|nr:alanine aminotransferase 2-like isoform X3 [Stylophora pistillata]XP_022791361.1 alanine aminotransferase 2-like isoform X3 [Stylophora pistillata]
MEILTEGSINPAFKRVKYGVRGWLEGRSYEIQQELARGAEKPFSEVLIHYGNPQGMGQPPITFFRQVLALLLCPDLQNDERFPQDAKRRAKRILDDMIGHTVGSYTATQGINVVREDIANFISQRDGHPAVADDIYLTDGGAEGLEVMLGIVQIESHEETGRAGVMIPVPGFSMYQARLLQHNSYQIFYPLDEDNNWALNMATLERVLEEARPHCVPRALVLINPGNPTGQVLTYENVQEIVRFCAREKLVLFADEVYQANIHVDGVEFHSCKKVLRDMGAEYSNFQLISLHSGAKGYAGECGLRGGYIELVGFSEQVKARIKMYLSARSCSSTIGQFVSFSKVIMGLICNPPRPGDESYDRFSKEKETVLKSHKKKAKLATEVLNSMEGVKCNEVRGAVYAFPRITLPKKAIEEAKTKGLPPDEFYCWKALEKTGSYFVPGHGFDMNGSNNHYYFRITILPSEDKFIAMFERLKTFHQEFMTQYKD